MAWNSRNAVSTTYGTRNMTGQGGYLDALFLGAPQRIATVAGDNILVKVVGVGTEWNNRIIPT